ALWGELKMPSLVETKVVANIPAAAISVYTRIRDRIVIDAKLKKKLEAADTANFIVLVAREIEHAPGVDLFIPGGSVTIVATRYDGLGARIDVTGLPGAAGSSGRPGTPGLAAAHTLIAGGTGHPGGRGARGGDGGTIRLLAERLGQVDL